MTRKETEAFVARVLGEARKQTEFHYHGPPDGAIYELTLIVDMFRQCFRLNPNFDENEYLRKIWGASNRKPRRKMTVKRRDPGKKNWT